MDETRHHWSEDLVQTEWRVGQKMDIAMRACETMKREINVFIGNRQWWW